ncbi:hypothetical protein [Azomonas macrocytogenes]|uniref:Uncharacterized protein n=1 Tax=Azomonas macrocytogenes TaxID=69962 RepID=A0A839T6M4_AZOMA|nr:hypothetical protein [Azomonas macrocytogenes]MBB3105157.1 hypothetical protein [Azomonas macrocytogenes]
MSQAELLVYSVTSVIGFLALVGIVGYKIADYFDKKHEAKTKAKAH